MKWWFVLVLILPFTQQPTKTPPDKRATEADRAQGAGHPKSTSNSQQTSNAAPMTQPSTVSENKAGTANSNVETDKGSKHTDDEGLGVQLALVVIGILQVFALCGQVYIYCRQAKIMTRQAHEMKRQRGYMRLQWKSMGEQEIGR